MNCFIPCITLSSFIFLCLWTLEYKQNNIWSFSVSVIENEQYYIQHMISYNSLSPFPTPLRGSGQYLGTGGWSDGTSPLYQTVELPCKGMTGISSEHWGKLLWGKSVVGVCRFSGGGWKLKASQVKL